MEDFTTRQGRHNGNREDLTDGLYYEKDNDQINNTLKFEIDAEVSANAAVRAGSATGNAMTSITLDDDGLQRLLDEKFPRQNYHDYIMSFNFTGNKGNHTCFCPIKEFKDFDLIKVLPCGDFFHADCLDKQVKSGNRICHNCAADFTDFLIASEAQVEAHIGTQGEAQGEEVEMASASASVSTSASAEDLGHTEREAKNQADHETKSVRINAPSIKSVRTRTVTVNSPGSDFYNSYLNMDD
ncbi:hypothetical protein PACTADRAFT_50240 [Pachysolen tannophilus NRRL Y-2460]|uniref:RING-type domain-containing protein n=1 Tax=Pachysolen tannophilus NRRL Y-2460 TaxID=669874 RepID=A0A1E4TUX2_PACTA|nr:hypothetical protein PACTADRAFT_50240 [Pachysolen tannophilus NRRL Y-2460]